MPLLHLASASPRRAQILTRLGLKFTAAGVDIDERQIDDETAEDMVRRLAAEKALAAQKPMPDVVLAADTAVVLDGRIFGKPRDQADAQSMLLQLSGRSHLVMTGVAMRCDGNERCILSTSRVTFREISPDEACAYWQSGESGDKAGAYAIQGLGGVFVERIEGSYSGVVGLPVLETAALLAIAGIDVIKNAAEARAADK